MVAQIKSPHNFGLCIADNLIHDFVLTVKWNSTFFSPVFLFVRLQIGQWNELKQEKFVALIEISISLLCVIFALLIDSCFDYKR